MKKIFIKSVAVIAFTTLILSGCKKYEDGPAISIIPKKERVANTWIVEQALEDNKDVTSGYDNYELYLTNDGDAELTAKYVLFGTTYTTETDGTWEFTNNQENIRFDYQDNDQDAEYQILKLTEKELWMRKIGQELELHLKEK